MSTIVADLTDDLAFSYISICACIILVSEFTQTLRQTFVIINWVNYGVSPSHSMRITCPDSFHLVSLWLNYRTDSLDFLVRLILVLVMRFIVNQSWHHYFEGVGHGFNLHHH